MVTATATRGEWPVAGGGSLAGGASGGASDRASRKRLIDLTTDDDAMALGEERKGDVINLDESDGVVDIEAGPQLPKRPKVEHGEQPAAHAFGNVPLSQQQQTSSVAAADAADAAMPPAEPFVAPVAPASPTPEPREEALDPGQQRAFDLAMSGADLFLTGGPGTGKSTTLKKIIHALRQPDKYGSAGVLVAAPTGVAALIADGQTLHSKPGPGVPKGTTEAFGNMKSKSSFDFWRRVKCLIIDEISMVDGEFLDWYMANVPPGESRSSRPPGHLTTECSRLWP